MPAAIRNISVDAADPYALAVFWSQVLGLPVNPDDDPGDDEIGIALDGLGGYLLFQRVPEGKVVKNRLHLCLQPDRHRDEEVEHLLTVGATLHSDQRHGDGTGWAVLADPEGNEFCILRSEAERAATGG